MLRRMEPAVVRSKSDQKSGDPSGFCHKYGYIRGKGEKLGKKKNIEMFERANGCALAGEQGQPGPGDVVKKDIIQSGQSGSVRQRTIDAIAKRVGLGDSDRR